MGPLAIGLVLSCAIAGSLCERNGDHIKVTDMLVNKSRTHLWLRGNSVFFSL